MTQTTTIAHNVAGIDALAAALIITMDQDQARFLLAEVEKIRSGFYAKKSSPSVTKTRTVRTYTNAAGVKTTTKTTRVRVS
jgi:hypothetical protein